MQHKAFPKSYARDSAVSAIGLYAEFGVGFVTSPIVARSLNGDTFGYYAFSIWLFGWLLIAANGPFAACIVKFGPSASATQSPAHASAIIQLVRKVHKWWAAAFGLAVFLVLTFIPVRGWENELYVLPFAAMATILCRSMYRIDIATAQSCGSFGLETGVQVVGSSLLLLLTIIVATLDATPANYIAVYCIVGVAAFATSRVKIRRLLAPTSDLPVSIETRKRITKYAVSIFIVTAIGLASHRAIEVFMLKYFFSPSIVGEYVIALLFARAGVDIVQYGLMSTLTPRLASRMGSASLTEVASSVANLVIVFLLIGLLIAGLAVLSLPTIIVIVYGSQFSGAILPSVTLVAIGSIAASVAPLSSLFLIQDNQRERIILAFLSVVVSVVSCIALIPRFGVVGAVIAHGLVAVTWAATSCAFATRLGRMRLPWARAGRAFVAFSISIVLAWFVVDRSSVVLVASANAVFLVVFAFLAIMLRCVGTREFAFVQTMLSGGWSFGVTCAKVVGIVAARFAWDSLAKREADLH